MKICFHETTINCIVQNPKSKSVDECAEKDSDRSEKSSKSTPKRSQSVSESLIKRADSSSEISPNKKKVAMIL